MIIDMHTHIFPEKIAAKTLSVLSERIHIPPYTDGTMNGLLDSAKEAGIDISVNLPVVTNPEQFSSINRFADRFHEGSLLSFGGIHPASEHFKEEILTIKKMGFPGFKLHPDYQDMYFNDIRIKRMISFANEQDLWVVTHAGPDPLCPDHIHCTPQMVREVLHDVQPDKLILAHMGANYLWDDMEEFIIGENVYLDTAYVLRKMPREQLIRSFLHHDSDKILFATDSPWSSQKEDVEYLRNLEIPEELKEKIFWKNAAKILKLSI